MIYQGVGSQVLVNRFLMILPIAHHYSFSFATHRENVIEKVSAQQ